MQGVMHHSFYRGTRSMCCIGQRHWSLHNYLSHSVRRACFLVCLVGSYKSGGRRIMAGHRSSDHIGRLSGSSSCTRAHGRTWVNLAGLWLNNIANVASASLCHFCLRWRPDIKAQVVLALVFPWPSYTGHQQLACIVHLSRRFSPALSWLQRCPRHRAGKFNNLLWMCGPHQRLPERQYAMGHAELCSRNYANVTVIGAHDSFAFSTDVLQR